MECFEQKQDLVDEISDKLTTMTSDDLEQILELVDELQEEQTKKMIARLKAKKNWNVLNLRQEWKILFYGIKDKA